MQTCYNCGKQVPDETLICPDCGALVRRYTAPAAPEQTTVVQPAPAAQGRVRLQGAVKVWLIILCVFSGYMAFSSLCSVFFAAFPQMLDEMLADPGMEALAPMISSLQEVLPIALPLFILLTVLFTAKFICHLWLLLSARRLPFYMSVGVSVLGVVLSFLFGGTLAVVLYFIDPVITWLGLKRFWPNMPK